MLEHPQAPNRRNYLEMTQPFNPFAPHPGFPPAPQQPGFAPAPQSFGGFSQPQVQIAPPPPLPNLATIPDQSSGTPFIPNEMPATGLYRLRLHRLVCEPSVSRMRYVFALYWGCVESTNAFVTAGGEYKTEIDYAVPDIKRVNMEQGKMKKLAAVFAQLLGAPLADQNTLNQVWEHLATHGEAVKSLDLQVFCQAIAGKPPEPNSGKKHYVNFNWLPATKS